MEAREVSEDIEKAARGEAAEEGGSRKRVALLIAVLAAMLAVTEMGGRGAQNEFNALNIEVANLWSFFQAKTVRATVNRTAASLTEAMIPPDASDARQQALHAQMEKFLAEAARLDSEPSTNEGREQLSARARAAEARRGEKLAAFETFELASAALQLGVVLASAGLLTSASPLILLSILLGIGAAGLDGLAWFAPHLMAHLG